MLELANYELAVYFSEFGYDIYEKNDIFYNNICSSAYIDSNDIVIKDRKRYIFPNNVSLCLNYCIYETSDLEGKRILCNCNLNINNNSHNYNEENYFEIEEDDNNFINYLLDKINYEIYKCYSLLYIFDNYIKKIAFYVLVFILLIYIILIIRFFAHRIFYIRKTIINNIKKSKKQLLLKSIKRMKSLNLKGNPVKQKAQKIGKNNGQTNVIFKNVNIYMPIKINQTQTQTKVQSNKIIKRKSKRGLTVNVSSISKRIKIDEKDYNDMPYNKAIKYDKRDFLTTFTSVVLEKIELINIFNNNKTHVRELLLCQYLLSLIVDFYFNAIFYSDDIISHKYHNKGKLDFIVSLLLS